MCECTCISASRGSTPAQPRTYPTISSPSKAPHGTFPDSARARIISRGRSWCSPHVAVMTAKIRSASASEESGRNSTPAAFAAESACCQGVSANPGRLAAGGRRQLLPLRVVEVLAAASLHELHDPREDRPDERELEQLAEEPALLGG